MSNALSALKGCGRAPGDGAEPQNERRRLLLGIVPAPPAPAWRRAPESLLSTPRAPCLCSALPGLEERGLVARR